jgi:hypothetical protein
MDGPAHITAETQQDTPVEIQEHELGHEEIDEEHDSHSAGVYGTGEDAQSHGSEHHDQVDEMNDDQRSLHSDGNAHGDLESEQAQFHATAAAATPISWKDASKHVESDYSPSKPSFTDKTMLDQVEINAKQSAANLVVLVNHLRSQLQTISALSVQHMTLHKKTIEGVSENIHEGMASTQKLILKAQALNAELKRVYTVQQDIKETKKMVAALEKLVERLCKS